MDKLAARTLVALGGLPLGMGVLLFLPAGTFDYWPAWVYMALVAGASALITLYLWRRDRALLERRMVAGPAAEGEPEQKRIQTVMLAVIVGFMVLPGLDHRFGWSHVPVALVILGDLITAVGFYLTFLVYRENTFAAATVTLSEGQRVISTGPYAVVRHPMYAGALVLFAGAPLALGSWWDFIWLIPLAAGLVWRLRGEETFLAKHLAGYDAYRSRVRHRLLPGLW